MMNANISVALYQLGFDPNSRHSVKRSRSILHDLDECKKFLTFAAPNKSFSDKNAPYEVDRLLREHAHMPALTKAEFFGSNQKEKKMAKAKDKTTKAKAPAKDKAPKTVTKKIHLIGLEGSAKKRGFNEGSLRAQCFALVKDGMTAASYMKAAEGKNIEAKRAAGALSKMASDGILEVIAA